MLATRASRQVSWAEPEKVDMACCCAASTASARTPLTLTTRTSKPSFTPAGSSRLLLCWRWPSRPALSGRALIDALVLGIDVSCRVGNAMYPDHYDRGWHITGSTGSVGAAAGCARLLGLNVDQTVMALGIAASQPIGVREQFGSMTKPFHPGGAARAGLMSALLAQQGFTASTRALEAPRGMMQTISTKNDWSEITGGLGKTFEIVLNTFKPFACGIVIHPSIDGCAQLRAQGVLPEQIVSLELKVHSLVLELTGKKEPVDGLQAKFSVYHGCAAGLTFGQATETEFSDEVVTRPDMVALRRKVNATVDDTIEESAVDLTARLTDGRQVHVRVEHAIGSLQNPMTDAQLEEKFHGLSDPILGDKQDQRTHQFRPGPSAMPPI
jgi:2-methylcitrate dehydratase PrpD